MGTKKKGAISVRVDERSAEIWKMYAKAADLSMPVLISNSINEYIDNHPLTGYRQKIFEERKGRMAMTVRDWITEEAEKAYNFQIDHYQNGYALPEHEVQEYINYLVDLSCDEWDGTDDPGEDENERLRDRIINWLEERTEKDVPEMVERHQMETE